RFLHLCLHQAAQAGELRTGDGGDDSLDAAVFLAQLLLRDRAAHRHLDPGRAFEAGSEGRFSLMTREVPPLIASRGRNVFLWLGLAAAGLGALLLYLFNPAG